MSTLPRSAIPGGYRVTVNTSADRLDIQVPAAAQRVSLLVRNRGQVAADVGASDVAAGAGFELAPGDALSVDLAADSGLYAVTASGSTVLHVLQVAWR
ncbi:hypothetical protein [Nonomuraea sp. bgisy101]|uniref:hypothetical protein n=1 Tax=Nonomuraea sp. bgisy101 TaxID=3413784 RepID=UPI003D723648